MKPPLERNVRNEMKKYLRDEYGATVHVYHGHAMGESSHPDLYGTLPGGRAFWFEVKSPGSKHDAARLLCQLDFLRREHVNGAVCGMVSSVGAVDIAVQDGFYAEKEWLDKAATRA